MVEDTPYGQYLVAEVDGNVGRDVIEFLVKLRRCGCLQKYGNVSFHNCFRGQEERMKKIIYQLDWYSPTFDSMVE